MPSNKICLECDARCCRGVGVDGVVMTLPEAARFKKSYPDLKFTRTTFEGEPVKMMVFNGNCPFLDAHKDRCKVYEDRPETCKNWFCFDQGEKFLKVHPDVKGLVGHLIKSEELLEELLEGADPRDLLLGHSLK